MELIKQAINQLQLGHRQKAAQLFLESYHHELIPEGITTPKQLAEVISPADASHLVSALAHMSCVCCQRGITKCENCKGTGRISNDDICEACLGIGIVACKFCGGTGWISLEDIPQGFVMDVLVERIKVALYRIMVNLESSTEIFSSDASSTDPKEYLKQFLLLNRQLAVIEAGMVFLEAPTNAQSASQNQLEKLIELSVKKAIQAWRQIRELLGSLAQCYLKEAQKTSSANIRKIHLQQKADYYQSLHDSFDCLNATEWEFSRLYQKALQHAQHKQQQNQQAVHHPTPHATAQNPDHSASPKTKTNPPQDDQPNEDDPSHQANAIYSHPYHKRMGA
ncbi:MAG: hypothetical protein JW936_01640 [Sedimentisphaerales bacterium]|nr:hypothetical protein [Sedimentisphaerales bacterium]